MKFMTDLINAILCAFGSHLPEDHFDTDTDGITRYWQDCAHCHKPLDEKVY